MSCPSGTGNRQIENPHGLCKSPDRQAMSHTFETSMTLPMKREQVFLFFSEADNLERITPPELGFSILTPLPIDMKEGAMIDYKLSLFGLSLTWRTLISTWDPPNMFVDEQVAGPYRQWIHTHRFIDEGDSTRMIDHVDYKLPFFPFGEVGAPLIRLQIKRIFRFRQKAIRRILMPS